MSPFFFGVCLWRERIGFLNRSGSCSDEGRDVVVRLSQQLRFENDDEIEQSGGVFL